MNKQDYMWIQQSRQLILAQCKTLTHTELNTDHGFALKTVKATLIHITKCYRNWIGGYLLGNEFVNDYPQQVFDAMTFEDIEALYDLVDRYVHEAIERYEATMNVPVESVSGWKNEQLKTPHHLLLHAFTHECHHKGQLTSMLHLMGHTPKNTNIVVFDSNLS